ncbi:MAG: D-sedoheptulose 7-phosphate isomerase [Candidatus Tectomicrobia bacterium]|uniref:Phosphoheptose isomerase n=1 Tax=Tectimicrobiota bacterium TaxID=2528274 RepID=A0A938B1M0_UNCTE|nr:D-sedoheptulose 7-phosphate isomerase [Candidatus Tectomicrobia bacterium]
MEDITQELRDSAALKLHVAETQGSIIQAMIECIWASLQQGGKLLLCGNGGSAGDAQHLATECMVRLEIDRAPIPALALTTDTSLLTAAANDHGFETIFARQVAGLGRAGDVLLALSTSGNSRNVIRAVEEARRRGLHTLGWLGKDGGQLKDLVDLALVVPSTNTQRIQEVHITVGHILCGVLERRVLCTPLDIDQEPVMADGRPCKTF